jgi:6-pyruvoyltetrahydropterin/6-carboxytetrahydropterin synthase
LEAHLTKIAYVEAAHRNPKGNEKQQRLHGHSYKVEILAKGGLDPEVGWIVDYSQLKRLFRPLYDQLDHACLNDIPGLEDDTTVPALERWIDAHLTPKPAWYNGVRVSIDGDLAFMPHRLPPNPFEKLPERLIFSFEAAQSLPQLPATHPCNCIHGHSYRFEVGTQNLDALESHLRAIYDELDHTYLNEVAGLECATCERICKWVWDRLVAAGEAPTVVVVQETYTARCIYYGD